jgi:hypothetical protein
MSATTALHRPPGGRQAASADSTKAEGGHLLLSTPENMRRVSAPRASRGSQAAAQSNTDAANTSVPNAGAANTSAPNTGAANTGAANASAANAGTPNAGAQHQQRPGWVPRIYRTVR